MTEAETQVNANEVEIVEDLNTFLKKYLPWHKSKIRQLQHMLTVPDGMEVQLGDETTLILTGDALIAFRIGIELCLSELGKLPFNLEPPTIH